MAIFCKNLKFIKNIEGYDYYEFTPTLGMWFFKNYDKMYFKRWIRMLLEFIQGGYKVYYMMKNDDVLAYCLVAKGGRRLKCTTKKDIVLGPYFVMPNKRGQGLSKILIDIILNKLEIEYESAYDYIHKDNIPSIRASIAVGFREFGRANITKHLRKIKVSADKLKAEYIIFKYNRTDI